MKRSARRHGHAHHVTSPLSEERAAGVFDALQLQETRPHQQRLHVLLVNGEVAVVGEVDQSFQGTRAKSKDALQRRGLARRRLRLSVS